MPMTCHIDKIDGILRFPVEQLRNVGFVENTSKTEDVINIQCSHIRIALFHYSVGLLDQRSSRGGNWIDDPHQLKIMAISFLIATLGNIRRVADEKPHLLDARPVQVFARILVLIDLGEGT